MKKTLSVVSWTFGRELMSTKSKNVGSLIKLFKYIVENIGFNEKNAIKKSARKNECHHYIDSKAL